jgi:hypothetical protein
MIPLRHPTVHPAAPTSCHAAVERWSNPAVVSDAGHTFDVEPCHRT